MRDGVNVQVTAETETRTGLLARLRGKAWLKPFRSAGVLLIGRSAQGVLSLVAVALAARALGAVDFGTLTLLHSFVLMVGEMVRFQSWQPVLRYGAPAMEAGDTPRLQRILRFGLMLDVISACIGAGIVLLAMAPMAGLLGIPVELHDAARWYGLSVVFFMLNSAANGALRLCDRFDLLSAQSAIAPLIRVIGSAALLFLGGGLVAFLAVWFVASMVGRLYLPLAAWHEMRRRGLSDGFWRSMRGSWRPEPGIWGFSLGTNLSTSLGTAQQHLGVLAVGWVLGPAAAGLFRVARQFANVLSKPTQKLLVPSIYPELARLTAKGKTGARRKMVVRTALLSGGISALVFAALAVFGETLIALVVGPEFTEAYTAMLWLAFAGMLGVWLFPVGPLLISTGWVRLVVTVRLVAMIGYLVALYFAMSWYGLAGAGMATLAHVLLGPPLMLLFGRRALRAAFA
ncbi:lipopolysaccharide biosynthesis protein [Ferruginivarius sediminum]|uniref:lipopolysaccharide biosynthesis protein n=1 Tax=Ferruginivarius sediminum TaxID=2661937 RepID=UPI00137B728F|nr:oligosaccharide flippase family protein [Ferruginivarius sediminum]